MRKILKATLWLILPALALSACTILSPASLTEAQNAARTENRELILATAAINIAGGTAQAPGVSPLLKAQIKAGVASFSDAVQAQVASAHNGGDVTSQAMAGLIGAVEGGVPNIGGLLASAHGSSVTPEELAVAGGVSALSQLPSIAGLLANDLNPSFVPSDAVLGADLTNLQNAAAAVAKE